MTVVACLIPVDELPTKANAAVEIRFAKGVSHLFVCIILVPGGGAVESVLGVGVLTSVPSYLVKTVTFGIRYRLDL